MNFFNKFDGLVHDYSNSSALAKELLQSCTKPLHWGWDKMAIILQMAYQNQFAYMKIVAFWFKLTFVAENPINNAPTLFR